MRTNTPARKIVTGKRDCVAPRDKYSERLRNPARQTMVLSLRTDWGYLSQQTRKAHDSGRKKGTREDEGVERAGVPHCPWRDCSKARTACSSRGRSATVMTPPKLLQAKERPSGLKYGSPGLFRSLCRNSSQGCRAGRECRARTGTPGSCFEIVRTADQWESGETPGGGREPSTRWPSTRSWIWGEFGSASTHK